MEKKKKLHWTKAPGGKEKLAAAMQKSWKTRRSNGGKPTPQKTKPTSSSRHRRDVIASKEASIQETPVFAYALGHIECWIDAYAASAGVPPESLAAELGKVLQIKARR